ncbi:MAG: bifunctional methylenetetrahydrofolate dehydrogenase/methenyltetrahydrofolate cyclohydrolase FolD [Firmicutes bacterium]|nr:bifunctional methylenetetrahydrofolate dehydrogenase/methenyltetrahydrofolate cyclohydrolase FolD [Bacillota bacterium]
MPATIIDGKQVSASIRAELAKRVEELKAQHGLTPGIGVILVGDDPASQSYVKSKEKTAHELGFHSETLRVPAETSEAEVLRMVEDFNRDPKIHGILVQLPLPPHIDENKVLYAIDPKKDVDGFHPVNIGRLHIGEDCFVPCTPAGIIELLDRTGVDLKGKNAVVVGRSNIVGKPVAMLLLGRHATVTICHSRTRDLAAECRRADVLVAAVGKARLITGDMIKPGAVVIDVGVNRVEGGKLVGDVDFDSAVQVASAITPVPGGVGPMTICMLMKNTVLAAERTLR